MDLKSSISATIKEKGSIKMPSMEKESMKERLYRCDNLVITGFMVLMWSIFSFVLWQVVSILETGMERFVVIGSALMAGSFCTASLFAVMVHLRQKKHIIYAEDIDNLLLLRRSKTNETFSDLTGNPDGPQEAQV